MRHSGVMEGEWPHSCYDDVPLLHSPQVRKAEGGDHRQWWTYKPPNNITIPQLQQLAARLGAASAAGLASSANTLELKTTAAAVPPKVQASSGPAHSSTPSLEATQFTASLLQRWLLAELGMAAQQQLTQPCLQDGHVVRATDGAPRVTADATDDVEASLSNAQHLSGSKNQDPGIPVDARAVARPGELAGPRL